MTELRQEVERLALPGGRVVGSPGHVRAMRYLQGRLEALGLEPYRGDTFALPYRTAGYDFCNLVSVVPGLDRSLAPVLIGAHYDSVIPAPCADDNAAAVAIALSAAECFLQQPARRDVVIALFDAEEPPFFRTPAMGSIRFYEDQLTPVGCHAALVMDLVGHDVPLPIPQLAQVIPTFSQLLFVTGAESHPAMPDIVRANRIDELPVIATLNRRVGDMSDHGIFRQHNDPYLFLTCARWSHYHQESDTPDRLNYDKMGRIRDYLVNLVRSLADTSLLPAADRPGHELDTTSFEIAIMREALGEAGLTFLLGAVGVRKLETSADLDALALRLQSYFEL